MKLTPDHLKGDEQRLIHELGAAAGALAYNRQLQAFLAKEEPEPPPEAPPEQIPDPPPVERAPQPQPNGGIPQRELTPHG